MASFPSWSSLKSTVKSMSSSGRASSDGKVKSSSGRPETSRSDGGSDALVSRTSQSHLTAASEWPGVWVFLDLALVAAATGAAYCGIRYFLNLQSQRRRLEEEEAHYQRMLLDLDQPAPPRRDEVDGDDEDDIEDRYRRRRSHDGSPTKGGDDAGAARMLTAATGALISPVVSVLHDTVSLSFGVLRDARRLWERLMHKVEQRSSSTSSRLRRTLDLSSESSAAALLATRRRLECDLAAASELLGSTHNLAGSALVAARHHLETEFRETARTLTKLATSISNANHDDPTTNPSQESDDAAPPENTEEESPELRRRKRRRQLRQRRRQRRQSDILLTLGTLLVSSTASSPAAWRRYGLHPILTLVILTRLADMEEEDDEDDDEFDDLTATAPRQLPLQAPNHATIDGQAEEQSSSRSSSQSPQPPQSHFDRGDQRQKQNPGEETRAAIGMSTRGKSQSLPPLPQGPQTTVLRFSPTGVSPSEREVMTLTAPPSPFENSPGYHLTWAPGTEGPSRSESFSSYPSLPFPSNQSQSRHQPQAAGQPKGSGGRHIELLVHNVSHADMVLSLGMTDRTQLISNLSSSSQPKRNSEATTDSTSTADDHVLCRPRFSAFALYATRVLQALEQHSQLADISDVEDDDVLAPSSHEQNAASAALRHESDALLADTIISYPLYERSDADCYQLTTPKRPSQQRFTAIGFDLDRLPRSSNSSDDHDDGLRVHPSQLPSLRVRGRDTLKIGTLCDKIMKLHQQMQAEAREQEALSDARKTTGESGGKSAATTQKDTPLSPRSDVESGDFPGLSEMVSPSKMELQALDLAMSDLETARAVAGEIAEAASSTRLHINSIFFPILSTLLPRWESHIQSKYPESRSNSGRPTSTGQNGAGTNRNIKQVLILVSGVGSPRHWTHSSTGNSTEACAKVMEIFVRILYPNITVVRIHSETNIFRYDDNISFAKRELAPCVDAYRDAHARGEPYPDELPSGKKGGTINEDWKQTFSVAVSFADGSPARTHAIQAALRHYRPTYFHFWQLKTFWHEGKVCFDDLEMHSFEDMETEPAIDVSQTPSVVRMVVNEMQAFRREFLESLLGGRSDVPKFWLRKSKKPVLAVLLVDSPGKGPVLYRGTNMEVSMPTGSLCAERNVIGTALAANPGLRREDIKMVGVLAVPLPTGQEEMLSTRPPLPGEVGTARATIGLSRGGSVGQTSAAGASGSSVDGFDDAANFVSDVTEKLLQLEQQPMGGDMTRSMSFVSLTSIVETEGTGENRDLMGTIDNITSEMMSAWEMEHGLNDTFGKGDAKPGAAAFGHFSTPDPGTPVRRIKLYNGMDGNDNANGRQPTLCRPATGGGRRKQQKTVVVHSTKDLNPLRPCGACNEWLKKISESNPSFKVITFTDADCNGVYVTSCDE